ncbi:arf-GAP with Rho-GAP domain, ANK repeat and PH domain-containing protein 1 [Polymixia lowei]
MASAPPVPKPRARYKRDQLSLPPPADSDLIGDNMLPTSSKGIHRTTDEDLPPHPPLAPNRSEPGVSYPTLASVTTIISANIPSLAGVASSFSTTPSSIPSAPNLPASAGLGSLTNSITSHIPSLAGAASTVANPAATAPPYPYPNTTHNPATANIPSCDTSSPNAASLDNIVSSLSANIPSLAGMVSSVANPVVCPTTPAVVPPVPSGMSGAVSSSNTTMLHPGNISPAVNMTTSATSPGTPPSGPKPCPPSLLKPGDTRGNHTDIEALSQFVMATLDHSTDHTTAFCPPEDVTSPGPMDHDFSPSPKAIKGHSYITFPAPWGSQEEPETESSNEEEDSGVVPTSPSADGPMEADLARDPTPTHLSNSNGGKSSQSGYLDITPCRPAPPPPSEANQSRQPGKPLKLKTPRAATIRVSRKKGGIAGSSLQSAVVRAGWLDVWKGFRHNVLWATLDGHVMSLWKKRTDKFSEVVFHVSSVTNVKKQDKGRFSIYFRKKHYDFMAHNDAVQEGWVSSLLASRGQASPAPPELQGQIAIKDPRSRAYAAVSGHDLWVYHNKEDYQLGVGWFSVHLNVTSVKQTGKHTINLLTPYKTFSLSVDSSRELSIWLGCLSSSIRNALSCSQVAMQLWENPFNKVCGDCGAANPEWASVNLLLVICEACAGLHRALGSSVSKVRSLKLDNKVWTEPLIQLFIRYGNRVANQVWSPIIPASEQLHADSPTEERSKFIQDKYTRGRYRVPHPLASSHTLLNQRLCEVVCGEDVEETMTLLCSGAKVLCHLGDPQSPSPITLAERAGQALQTELLRHNEYTEVPPYVPQSANRIPDSTPSAGEDEELHGKLEEDRFLFSLENDSAACDVLDLREVRSVCMRDSLEFEMVTLNNQLICAADTREALLSHLLHILKVILPVGVSETEVGGALAVSKVCVNVGGALEHSEVWAVLQRGRVTIYPAHTHQQHTLQLRLDTQTNYEMDPSVNTVTLVTAGRVVCLRFKDDHSCLSWSNHLKNVLANQSNHHPSLYLPTGTVPPGIEHCIAHITKHGLKVEGIYRRCGLATKVALLVEALVTTPSSAPLESDEQGVLDAASALKRYVRQQPPIIPQEQRDLWEQAAVVPDEKARLAAYRQLLWQLPDDNRATLSALCAHFYLVQVFSAENLMTCQNLSLVLVPTLFQDLKPDMVRLTRELILHHVLLFLSPEEEEEDEEQITIF